jgi:nitroreductase
MNKKIKKAVDISQRAQRNYDLSKTIPKKDLETLIYAAKNSPSKQNETHYSIHVYTDKDVIRRIYNCTKLFGLPALEEEGLYENRDGNFWQDENRCVHNSQILANAVFVFVETEGEVRGGTHMLAKKHRDTKIFSLYQEQKHYSLGISVGQLILSATLLGYKTGICSALNTNDVAAILNVNEKPKLVIGIGFENAGVDRRLHAETLNRDLEERFRNGGLEEQFRFPSFEKNTTVNLNGEIYE